MKLSRFDWHQKLARAKRRRILLQRKLRCRKTSKGVVVSFKQRTYVGVDGVAFSCTSGDLWGDCRSNIPFILRTTLRIDQHRRRLERRKKMQRRSTRSPSRQPPPIVSSIAGTSGFDKLPLVVQPCPAGVVGNRCMPEMPYTHPGDGHIDSLPSTSLCVPLQRPSKFCKRNKGLQLTNNNNVSSDPKKISDSREKNLQLTDKHWSSRFARGKRKRLLFEQKIRRLNKLKGGGVIKIRQRTFVGVDGVAITCTSGDIWGTPGSLNQYAFRPRITLEWRENRLERSKRILRKRKQHMGLRGSSTQYSICAPSTSGLQSGSEHGPNVIMGVDIVGPNMKIFDIDISQAVCSLNHGLRGSSNQSSICAPSTSVLQSGSEHGPNVIMGVDIVGPNMKTSNIERSQVVCSLNHGNLHMHQSSEMHTRTSVQNVNDNIEHVCSGVWNFGPPSCTCSYCGAVVWYEERSEKSKSNSSPKFTICCQGGKVELPYLQDCPPYLKSLLDYKGGRKCNRFREQIRLYNSTFAFTSMGGHVDNSVNNGKGPYVFRLNGQNHHRIGSLLPTNDKPRFVQLYIYDTENETGNRMGAIGGCGKNKLDVDIVEGLMQMFDAHNELAKVFRMARDRFNEADFRSVSIKLVEHRHKDARQYNLPTSSEIAGLVTCCEAGNGGCRDVIVEEKSGLLKRINEKHPSFMAMQYPILFPYAEDGFRPAIEYRYVQEGRSTKRSILTIREFYAFRIQQRMREGWTLLCGGRLFQQFLVDAYTTVEEERFRWVRNNQKNIRSDLYRGLQDAVTLGDTSARCIGKRTVLPSSFTGGPRYMVQNYQDAIAICRWGGSPDLFLTFTCNPKWVEIKYFLDFMPGQRPEDRPDIIARVFKIKLNQLLHDIRKGKHFGRVLAAKDPGSSGCHDYC